MDALDSPQSRVALRTCNESGKTSVVVASVVAWHLEMFAHSLTITTAGVSRQVRDQLYPHLQRHAARTGAFEISPGMLRGYCAHSGSRLVSFTADDPGLAEGWHFAHDPTRYGDGNPLASVGVSDAEWAALAGHAEDTSLLIVIDEAKSVPAGIFDALLARCRPTRMLVCSSPGEPMGPFFDAFHGESRLWPTQIVAPASSCDHLWADPVRRRELDELEAAKGRDNPLVMSSIYAEFSTAIAGGLFNMLRLDMCMGGQGPRYGRGERYGALDISGGGDEQVLFVRDGNEAWMAGVWMERDDRRLVSLVIAKCEALKITADNLYADAGGLGAIILNEFDRRRWHVQRIDFGAAARNTRWYANCRCEMYSELADRIKRQEIRLQRDKGLKEQLSWQRYAPNNGGPLLLVPKKTMPHSPDRADALAMLFYDAPSAAQYREVQQQQDIAGSRTMLVPDSELFESNRAPESGGPGTGFW